MRAFIDQAIVPANNRPQHSAELAEARYRSRPKNSTKRLAQEPKRSRQPLVAAHCRRRAQRAPSSTRACQALHCRSASSRTNPTNPAEWECARCDHPRVQPWLGRRAKSGSSDRAAVAAGEEQNARSTAPFKPFVKPFLQSFDQATANTQAYPNSEIKRASAASHKRPTAISSTITWMLNDECGPSARNFRPLS